MVWGGGEGGAVVTLLVLPPLHVLPANAGPARLSLRPSQRRGAVKPLNKVTKFPKLVQRHNKLILLKWHVPICKTPNIISGCHEGLKRSYIGFLFTRALERSYFF